MFVDNLKNFWNNLMSNPFAKKAFYGIVIFIFIIIFVMLIASCSSKKTYTYLELEEKMVSLAQKKYSDKTLLPQNDGGTLEVNLQTFVDDGSLKNIQDIVENKSVCSGKVTIINNNGNYLYLPYLNCASDYKTKTLYDELTKDTVTAGNGLYKEGEEYIFKGENVNNYLKLNNIKYRIIKINSDSTIRALDTTKRGTVIWDDHYNIDRENNDGINIYFQNNINSRIKNSIEEYYNNEEEFTEEQKGYFKTQDICIGKRSYNDFVNDGSIECSEKLEKQVFGLIQVNEYFKASLDPNCTSMESQSCTNYNYFGTMPTMWSITTDKDTSYKAYKINSDGVHLAKTSSTSNALITVRLDKDLIVTAGTGTENDPYLVGNNTKK